MIKCAVLYSSSDMVWTADTGCALSDMGTRLVDWYRGYGATTPCAPRPFVRRHLVLSVISGGALCQATPETSVTEERK
jgi:hypothetical protein